MQHNYSTVSLGSLTPSFISHHQSAALDYFYFSKTSPWSEVLRYKCKPLQPKCKSHSSTLKDFTGRRVNRLWFVWDPTLGFIPWLLCAAVACNRYLKRTALQNSLIINNKSINCTASQQCWNSHSFAQLTGSKVWHNYIVSFANDSEHIGYVSKNKKPLRDLELQVGEYSQTLQEQYHRKGWWKSKQQDPNFRTLSL